MIDGIFNVVFRGQIVKSFDEATVKDNLVKLFKSSPQAIERLFAGGDTIIRKSLDYSQAMKYQSALKKAGALALIQEVEAEQNDSQSPHSIPKQAQEQQTQEQQTQNQQSQAQQAAPQSQVESTSENEPTSHMTIAEVGAQILPPKEYEKREVDTSALSLGKVGEQIIPPKEPEPAPDVSIDHLKLT